MNLASFVISLYLTPCTYRAIHTNLLAKFKTEVLKLAVIKNGWLANRLGGDVFSVVCSYEEPNEAIQS